MGGTSGYTGLHSSQLGARRSTDEWRPARLDPYTRTARPVQHEHTQGTVLCNRSHLPFALVLVPVSVSVCVFMRSWWLVYLETIKMQRCVTRSERDMASDAAGTLQLELQEATGGMALALERLVRARPGMISPPPPGPVHGFSRWRRNGGTLSRLASPHMPQALVM